MTKRAAALAGAVTAVTLALGGCGVSVAAGGRNAATHPALGIWVSNTVGGGPVSGEGNPPANYRAPTSTPPASLPPGLSSTVEAVRAAVSGGCWDDAHQGNVYGAYDQVFWWQGDCGDTIGQVTVEMYPSAGSARSQAHHGSANRLLARYVDGAVVVDVYVNAPLEVLSALGKVKGLTPVPGYGA